jgi:hypothetical protein
MVSESFRFRAGSGVPGDIANPLNTVVESWRLDLTNPPLKFGAPVKLVNGELEAIEEDDAATVFYGILSRSVPGISGDDNNNDAVPNTDQTNGVAVSGYMVVTCTIGTPVANGAVYMRVVPDTGKLVGDLEATADGTDNVLLPTVVWHTNGKDANNVASVRIKY